MCAGLEINCTTNPPFFIRECFTKSIMSGSMSQVMFKYLLQHKPYVLLRQSTQTTKNVSVLINNNVMLWVALHLRLAQGFYKTQLVDIFAYETPSFNLAHQTTSTQVIKNSTTVVYNFHNLLNQTRYFVFTTSVSPLATRTHGVHSLSVDSVTELFATSW